MPTTSTSFKIRLLGLIVITALLGLGVVINLIDSPERIVVAARLHD